MSDRDLGAAATGGDDGSDSDDGGLKLPDNELGFRPLKLPGEASMFFGDLELDEELATMEILAGDGDAVEAIRCHAPILALRSTEIMKELLLCDDPPTPDEPLVLEFPEDDERWWEKAVHWAYTNELEFELEDANDFRLFAEERGFKDLAKIVSSRIAESMKSNPRKAFTIATKALQDDDTGMVKLAFEAAYLVADAIDSAAVRALPPHGFELFIADDRASGSEVMVFRAAVEWAETLMRAVEKAGKQTFERLRFKDGEEDSYVIVEEDEDEDKEDEEEDEEEAEVEVSGPAASRSGRRKRRTGGRFKPSSVSSMSSSFGASAGAGAGAGARTAAARPKRAPRPSKPTHLAGFDVTGCDIKPVRHVFAGAAIRAAMGDNILRQIRFPQMHPAELLIVVQPTGILTDDELAELTCYAMARVQLEDAKEKAEAAHRAAEAARAAAGAAAGGGGARVPGGRRPRGGGRLGGSASREFTVERTVSWRVPDDGSESDDVGGLFGDTDDEIAPPAPGSDSPLIRPTRLHARDSSSSSDSGTPTDEDDTSDEETEETSTGGETDSVSSSSRPTSSPRADNASEASDDDDDGDSGSGAAAAAAGGDDEAATGTHDDDDADSDDGLTASERAQLVALGAPGSDDPQPHKGKKSLWKRLQKRGERRLERLDRLDTTSAAADEDVDEDGYEGDEGDAGDDEDVDEFDKEEEEEGDGDDVADEVAGGLGKVGSATRGRRRGDKRGSSKEEKADERPRVVGYLATPRKPVVVGLDIMMWGGGGASGKFSGGGLGGAGGYLHVKYLLKPGKHIDLHVGEGGEASGDSGATKMAYPNGGKGAWDYRAGGGGGASYFTASATGDEVVAGAGGGGGGVAEKSWAGGGGGGGGTRDGKVGSKGDGHKNQSESETKGVDGNGDGGKNNSSGSKAAGANNHGAGGKPGSSATANGGAGGHMSCKHAKLRQKINATSHLPVVCPKTGLSHGAGASTANQQPGKSGAIVVANPVTGTRMVFVFSKTGPKVRRLTMQRSGEITATDLPDP